MISTYEGMFLLDNQVVREDWNQAKGLVTGTLEKHGGKVLTARRWDERRLAYPIRGRRRATYLLTYYQLPRETFPAMRRDFDLSEGVLRYLMLSVKAVPEGEDELAAAEQAADFSVPEPPPDDAPDPEEPSAEHDGGERGGFEREGLERAVTEPRAEEAATAASETVPPAEKQPAEKDAKPAGESPEEVKS